MCINITENLIVIEICPILPKTEKKAKKQKKRGKKMRPLNAGMIPNYRSPMVPSLPGVPLGLGNQLGMVTDMRYRDLMVDGYDSDPTSAMPSSKKRARDKDFDDKVSALVSFLSST